MNPLRLATAQTAVRDDPRDSGQLRHGIYAAHLVADNRSEDRGAF